IGILQNQRRATARLTGRAPVYKQFTHGVALVGTPQHPGQSTQERGLAGTGWPEQQHPLTRLEDKVHLRHREPLSARVPPPPAAGSHPSGANAIPHKIGAETLRPTANRASTPVDARARTRNHPSHPAKTVPDMDRVTRYVMRKSADFGQFGVRNSSPTHADAPAAAPASKPTISPHRR